MNFELDEEQVMLKTSARDVLDNECPKELVREVIDTDTAYSPELWKKMADLGWFGLAFPEEYGGVDFTFLEMSVLLEECGRALVPGPVIAHAVSVGRTILAGGTEEQKQELLPKLIDGSAIFTLAFLEESGGMEAAEMTVKAEKKGDSYVINGMKLFVPDAHISDYMLCVARTADGADKEKGITLLLVDAKAEGVGIEVLKTMNGEKLCEVAFNNVTVPASAVIGTPDEAWPLVKKMINETAVAEAAWCTGGARWVLDTSIDYAKERIAFDRPIGSFQAIQHKLSNMALEVEGSTAIMYYAAWAISENADDIPMAASMAKSWCSESYRNASYDGVQIHGGIGFTWDHDMHLYFKKAKSSQVSFGDADYHREKIAQLLEM